MRTRAGLWAVLAVVVALSGVWVAHRGRVAVPVIAQAPGHCVLKTSVMRRTHMMLLRAVREEIVRHDARDTRFRLTHCVACHAQRTSTGRVLPVNAPGQFCASCHAYVGVRLDCFACHAAVPAQRGLSAPLKTGALQAAFRMPRALRAVRAEGLGGRP